MNALSGAHAINVSTLRAIAKELAARHAASVDVEARFPSESVQALRHAGFMSALIAKELGRTGCSMRELADFCSILAQGCGYSGMVNWHASSVTGLHASSSINTRATSASASICLHP